MTLLDKAILIAAKTHAGQTDKAGKPYILHVLRVMMSMETEEEMITAVLHDTIEDSDLSIDDLRKEGIPENVINALKLLTHDDAMSYEDYIEQVKTNELARKVKLADLKDNSNFFRLNSFDEKVGKRLKKYFDSYKKLMS
jgi:(p)ppGpp synthase/HD superfamily hydrolase